RSNQSAPVLGMFEQWTDVMGGILSVADIPGFLDNLDSFYQASDCEGEVILPFIIGWWKHYKDRPIGVSELWTDIRSDNGEINLDLGGRSEQSQRVRLGNLLNKTRDRVYEIEANVNVRMVLAGSLHRAKQWKLVEISGESVSVGESVPPALK